MKTNADLIPLLIGLTLLSIACSDSPRQSNGNTSAVNYTTQNAKTQAPKTELPDLAKVIARYDVPGWPGEQCALYIPEQAAGTSTKVLILLDPHAKGRIPVERYHKLADQCGIVLCASNNAENGKSVQAISAYVQHLMSSVVPLLGADTVFTALMGFSGGARAAAVMAAASRFNTVILSGAGISPQDSAMVSGTNVIGVAGLGDGNLSELYRGTETGDLIYFGGGHEWPVTTAVIPAFHRLAVNAAQSIGRCPDKITLSRWMQEELEMAKGQDDLSAAALLSFSAKTYRNCLPDELSSCLKMMNAVHKKAVTADQRLRKMLKEEQRLQADYSSSMMDKDTIWWQKTVATLQKQSISTNDPARQMSAKRQLAFLGLAAYGLSRRAMASAAPPVAGHMLDVYHCIEPLNPEALYLKAGLYAGLGQDQEAMRALKMAARLGFSDINRVSTDGKLARLHSNPDYHAVLREIENNSSGKD